MKIDNIRFNDVVFSEYEKKEGIAVNEAADQKLQSGLRMGKSSSFRQR